jgi:hypothetical protein
MYASPIEERFGYNIVKYLREACSREPPFEGEVRFQEQHEARTKQGLFIIDFVVHYGDRRVGIECDGREFHDPIRDFCRDSVLLGENHIDAMYRFPGVALLRQIEDVLWFLAMCEPNLFSIAGRKNLETLASKEIRTPPWIWDLKEHDSFPSEGGCFAVEYWTDADSDLDGDRIFSSIFIRRSRARAADLSFWEFASSRSASFDALVKEYSKIVTAYIFGASSSPGWIFRGSRFDARGGRIIA